jgi:hypothetical protein
LRSLIAFFDSLQIYAAPIYVQEYLYAGITPLQIKWKIPDCPLKRGSFNIEGNTCHNHPGKKRTVLVQVTCFGAKMVNIHVNQD